MNWIYGFTKRIQGVIVIINNLNNKKNYFVTNLKCTQIYFYSPVQILSYIIMLKLFCHYFELGFNYFTKGVSREERRVVLNHKSHLYMQDNDIIWSKPDYILEGLYCYNNHLIWVCVVHFDWTKDM